MVKVKFNKEKLMFSLVIIDVLFFPYLRPVVIPFSYFLILYWCFKNFKNIQRDKDFKLIFICMLMMFFSTVIGIFINSQFGVFGDDLKRLIQYYFIFGYYFYFKWYFNKNNFKYKKYFIYFVLFVLLLALLFNSNVSLFGRVVTFWNSGNAYANSFIQNSVFSGVFRYSFIWTDPNNIAYVITGIIAVIFLLTNIGIGEKIILIIINIYILFSCMSSGGWINFFITYSLLLIYKLSSKKNIKKTINIKNIFILCVVLIIILFSLKYIKDFFNSDLVLNASERFKDNDNTRTEIWMKILSGESIFKHLILGKGSEIYINGVSRATHSGHLYWIYAYGFISYAIFMRMFFYISKKLKSLYLYIPMISFFLCFTMNTMIGEQKLFIIFVLIGIILKKEAITNEKSFSNRSNL